MSSNNSATLPNVRIETQFFDHGDEIAYVRANLTNRLDKPIAMVYKLVLKENGDVVLKKDKLKFELPEKLFGKAIVARTKMVLNHYEKKTKSSLGVMALGQKGCGKTEQMNLIANEAIERFNIPVIMIERSFSKTILENVAKAVGPCVMYFDEYEKTYSPNRPNRGSNGSTDEAGSKINEDELLTFFSDKELDKVIFLISANRVHDVSDFLINRPARFLFRFNYHGTDKDIVAEVCEHFKLKPDIAEFITEYVEDTKCSTDVTIHLADIASVYDNANDLTQIFESINAPKPKKFLWRVYTPSGTEEGLKVEAIRKYLYITHIESNRTWEINYDSFYTNFQYNSNYRCYVLSGLPGASEQVKIGFMPLGAAENKEEEETKQVIFFQLEDQNKPRQGFGQG